MSWNPVVKYWDTVAHWYTQTLKPRIEGSARDGRADPPPVHYPLLPVIAVIASMTVTTWLLPRVVGYVITVAVLGVIGLYGLVARDVGLTIDRTFLLLIGAYWTGLVVHYIVDPHFELLGYVVVTPIAVGATVVVMPGFIDGRRTTFTAGLAGVAVLATVVGLVVLVHELRTPADLYVGTGEPVFGLGNLRIASVFRLPARLGFLMMVGTLSALYTYLERRHTAWIGVLGGCVVGLVLSKSVLAFGVLIPGMIIVLSGERELLGYLGIAVSSVGTYGVFESGLAAHKYSNLLSRFELWRAWSEKLLSEQPVLGLGFVDPSTLGLKNGSHNSFLQPIVNTGVVVGPLYLGALFYGFATGLRNPWTRWTAFVVGLTTSIFVWMLFEGLFLGGLSIASIVLGIMLGLSLRNEVRS